MEDALQVIEQKRVAFYEDEIIAIRVKDGSIYVPIRPLCERLGLDWSGQRQRINRDAVLAKKVQGVGVITTPSQSGSGGGVQEMLALPLDYIGGFLFGVNANRVKAEVRDRLILYQEQCYQVLSDAFLEGRLNPETDFDALLLDVDNPAVQAYRTFQAMAKLARHQLILESRVDQHEERIEQLESLIGDTKHYLTPSQASQISQAVKVIAGELANRSGRNEYGGVYGELYRRFEVTSYKQLPKNRYEEAMHFLTGWYTELTGISLPF
jgi:hypothetical protein